MVWPRAATVIFFSVVRPLRLRSDCDLPSHHDRADHLRDFRGDDRIGTAPCAWAEPRGFKITSHGRISVFMCVLDTDWLWGRMRASRPPGDWLHDRDATGRSMHEVSFSWQKASPGPMEKGGRVLRRTATCRAHTCEGSILCEGTCAGTSEEAPEAARSNSWGSEWDSTLALRPCVMGALGMHAVNCVSTLQASCHINM